MKISFKTELNVCQFYIGLCCFNRNFISMYSFFLNFLLIFLNFYFILFFSVSKKKGGKEGKRKKYIRE